MGLRICISNKFPGDVDITGLGTTLWETLAGGYGLLNLLGAVQMLKHGVYRCMSALFISLNQCIAIPRLCIEEKMKNISP